MVLILMLKVRLQNLESKYLFVGFDRTGGMRIGDQKITK